MRLATTTAGYHLLSPLGTRLAPDLFLNAAPDTEGPILLTGAGRDWSAAATADSGHAAIRLVADTALDPAQPGDGTATIGITGIEWLRPGPAGDTVIGRACFDAPLSVTAVHSIDAAPGGGPAWRAEVADALAGEVRAAGLTVAGGPGADVIAPAADILPVHGAVQLIGRGGDDRLEWGRATAELRGGHGDDALSAEGGESLLRGGPGDDTLTAGPWSAGMTLRGGHGADALASSNGADLLRGGGGNDALSGGRGADRLAGGRGADRLDGGEGDDVLRGGPGDDTLTGGWGADLFVFRFDHAGHDRITDFDPAEDRLQIRQGGPLDAPQITQEGRDLVLRWSDGAASVTLDGAAGADPGGDAFWF